MKKTTTYLLLLTAFAVTAFSSCSKKLDLDEDTKIALEKQEKMKQLDALFELAFTDPAKAESDYYQFYTTQLLTDDQNFVIDNDVRMRNTFTDLAIRLNTNFEKAKAVPVPASLFDIYKAKFENMLFNKSLLGEIPQQLRKGEKLEKFENKINEAATYFDKNIDEFKTKQAVNNDLLNKNWTAQTFMISPDMQKFFILKYNFTLKYKGNLDIVDFYFYPLVTSERGLLVRDEAVDYTADIAPTLLAPVSYTVYGNKILFYFKLDSSPNPGDMKFSREWCQEFEYQLDGNQLVLSKPHVMLYMHPFLYISGYGERDYETNYHEYLRTPVTLTAQ
ncbi:MAG: hypothetical protein QM594_11255 [Niabella sp.]